MPVLGSPAGHFSNAAKAASTIHSRCCLCDVTTNGSTYARSWPSSRHQRVTCVASSAPLPSSTATFTSERPKSIPT
eukprot:4447601-Alexandrium_andersonii.AAC.1